MDKEFVPYELALKLKQLGFDEPCICRYYVVTKWEKPTGEILLQLSDCELSERNIVKAPLYQQAFRWFRENYSLYSCINTFTEELGNNKPYFIYEIRNPEQFQLSEVYNKYEEAELACLEKLIEIVESKSE
jgi:hypothetical protein